MKTRFFSVVAISTLLANGCPSSEHKIQETPVTKSADVKLKKAEIETLLQVEQVDYLARLWFDKHDKIIFVPPTVYDIQRLRSNTIYKVKMGLMFPTSGDGKTYVARSITLPSLPKVDDGKVVEAPLLYARIWDYEGFVKHIMPEIIRDPVNCITIPPFYIQKEKVMLDVIVNGKNESREAHPWEILYFGKFGAIYSEHDKQYNEASFLIPLSMYEAFRGTFQDKVPTRIVK